MCKPLVNRFRVALAVLFTALLRVVAMAQNLPSGGKVTSGQVGITPSGANRLDLNQATPRASIDWQTFSIGAGQAVSVHQPNAAAVLLNRVTGGTPSAILGSLTANGQVYLVNPAGVFFGAGAQVDVGVLVASTLDLSERRSRPGNWCSAATHRPDRSGISASSPRPGAWCWWRRRSSMAAACR